jgi:hypothetical protein
MDAKHLSECLQPDSLLERFAAKKANAVSGNKDFVKMKGSKGQLEQEVKCMNPNALIGFKCLHYSVTESNGTVDITV